MTMVPSDPRRPDAPWGEDWRIGSTAKLSVSPRALRSAELAPAADAPVTTGSAPRQSISSQLAEPNFFDQQSWPNDPLAWLEEGVRKKEAESRSRKIARKAQFEMSDSNWQDLKLAVGAGEGGRLRAPAARPDRLEDRIGQFVGGRDRDPDSRSGGATNRGSDSGHGSGARQGRAAAAPEAESDPFGALENAIAEIAARQDTLHTAPEPSPLDRRFAELNARVKSEPVRHAPSAGKASDESHIERFEAKLQALTEQFETLNRSRAMEQDAHELRAELQQISRALGEAMPRRALEALEAEVRALSQKVDASRQQSPNSAGVAELDQKLTEVLSALRALSPAETLSGFNEYVKSLNHRIEAAEAVTDATALQQLDLAISELRGIAARAASGDAMARLSDEVRDIAQHVESLAVPLSARGLVASSPSLVPSASGQPTPSIDALVAELSGKLESMQGLRPDPADARRLEDQLVRLSDRLEESDARLQNLSGLERTLNNLFAQLEATRHQAIEAAEHAARTAIREVAEGSVLGTDVHELRHDVATLREAQEHSERRTQDTLEAVHGALERLVDRLTQIEQDRAASGPIESRRADLPLDLDTLKEMHAATAADLRSPRAAPVPPPSPVRARERRPIDPTLPADTPIEPGIAQRARAAIARDAAPTDADLDPKASFIAAARRAAQAAANLTEPSGAGATGATAEGQPPAKSRKRAIMVGIAAFIVIVGLAQITVNILGGDDKGSAPAEQSAPVKSGALSGPVGAKVVEAPREQPVEKVADRFTPANLAAEAVGSIPPKNGHSGLEAEGKTRAIGSADAIAINLPARDVKSTQGIAALGVNVPGNVQGESRSVLPASIGGDKLREAAIGGDPSAEHEIGMRYLEGRGVPRSLEEAARWFERAANHGLVPAKYRLASMYEKGQGVRKDLSASRELYLAAAEKGHGKAMHNLAVLYAEGIDGKPDYKTASGWFRKAAVRGIADSQYNLGILYARGIGVEQNFVDSFKWFSLAALQGDQDAGKKRDDVAARIDAPTLAAARTAVKAWIAEPQADEVINVKAPPGGWDQVTETPGKGKQQPAAPVQNGKKRS